MQRNYKKRKARIKSNKNKHAWKQRKFSEVFEEYSEKKHPELPALTIIQGKGTILRDASDRNLLYDKANLASYKLVRKDDFIVHLRTFEGGLEKANSDGIVSPAYHIFHGKNTDTRFFYPFFRSKYFIDALLKPHVYGIRDGKSINIEGMKTISFLVPSFEEQNRIGKFVETLDNTITLQQRKLNSLQKLKKGLLQKMFPKNGENIPEIRFPEFSDAWKQRKLSCYLDVSSEKNIDNHFSKVDVLSVSGDYGVVNQIEFQGRSFAGVSVSNYGVVHTGNVIYTKSPLKATPFGIIKTNKGTTGIVSTLYAVYYVKENSYPNFIQDYFELNSRLNNYLRPLVNKGSKNDMKVSNENALKGLVIFPNLEEQRKISSFFAQLNNAITLQQRWLFYTHKHS